MARKNFALEAERDASILPQTPRLTMQEDRVRGTSRLGSAINIELDRLAPDSNQVRSVIDIDSPEMQDLATSISSHGILQPLTVFYQETNKCYQIISGERRYHAAKRAGLSVVPCLVRERPPSASEKKQLQLIENLHRKDMSALDEAIAFQALQQEHGLTLEEIGKQVGKSKSYISKAIRICDLSDEIKTEVATSQLAKKTLSFEHLLEIAKKTTPEEQRGLFEKIKGGRLNVKQVRSLVKAPDKNERSGRPRNFSHRFEDPERRFVVTVQFRTPSVANSELVTALRMALDSLTNAEPPN